MSLILTIALSLAPWCDDCSDCVVGGPLEAPCETHDKEQRQAVAKLRRAWEASEDVAQRAALLDQLEALPSEHGGATGTQLLRAYGLAARDLDEPLRQRALSLLLAWPQEDVVREQLQASFDDGMELYDTLGRQWEAARQRARTSRDSSTSLEKSIQAAELNFERSKLLGPLDTLVQVLAESDAEVGSVCARELIRSTRAADGLAAVQRMHWLAAFGSERDLGFMLDGFDMLDHELSEARSALDTHSKFLEFNRGENPENDEKFSMLVRAAERRLAVVEAGYDVLDGQLRELATRLSLGSLPGRVDPTARWESWREWMIHERIQGAPRRR